MVDTWTSGIRVEGLRFKGLGWRIQVWGSKCRVLRLGLGFRVKGLGFRVLRF
jgi:hypothetical protein